MKQVVRFWIVLQTVFLSLVGLSRCDTCQCSEDSRVNNVECGVRVIEDDRSLRIIGGRVAKLGKFPWQVGMTLDERHYCGGSLLSDVWVLTAAHCFVGLTDERIYGMKIVLAEHDRQHSEKVEQFTEIAELTTHPDYEMDFNRNDIALIKLKDRAVYTDYVQPVCLPDYNETFDGLTCTVTGWGSQEEGSSRLSRYLREVDVPVVTSDECVYKFPKDYVIESNLCAGLSVGGKDACLGDSGGPLVCRKPEESWKVVGVVSWGKGCGRSTYPGIYSKVAYYLDWIYDTTGLLD